MRLKKLRLGVGFRVVPGNRRSQAAEMVIPPGDAEGDARNRHRGADQWLYVLAGSGQALVKGERHEIRNTGRGLLRTLNFYVPPAYAKSGDPLSRGRR